MTAMLPFQQFQYAFAQHIRAPRANPRPHGVPERRMRIYNELLYNNLTGFLDACFPVARAVIGERRWAKLNRGFFAGWRSHTPYFREIPREFLRWLMEGQPEGKPSEGESSVVLPPFLIELAHYEWAELAVDVMDVELPEADRDGDLLQGQLVVNPALMNLAYQWPVQRIGPSYRPRKPRPTQLLVYRKRDDRVAFIEVNPVSARLIALLLEQPLSGRVALLAIADEIGHQNPEALVAMGASLLDELRQEEVILGTTT